MRLRLKGHMSAGTREGAVPRDRQRKNRQRDEHPSRTAEGEPPDMVIRTSDMPASYERMPQLRNAVAFSVAH